jgi:pimeloyl-ACP methyl ester carboxylesterase
MHLDHPLNGLRASSGLVYPRQQICQIECRSAQASRASSSPARSPKCRYTAWRDTARFRPGLEAIAHTLAYDAAITGELSLPTGLLASVTVPTLVICGKQSPPLFRAAARAVVEQLSSARLCELAGQTHDISPEATAPVIVEFLSSEVR